MNTRPALLLALLLATGAHAASDDAALVRQGRALYQGHKGFAAGIDATRLRLPPDMLACARCHGAIGEGGREGGQPVPPLRAAALNQPRGGLPAWRAADDVLRAITQGLGRDGRPLGPLMPRFALRPDEQAALLAYLRHLGTEADAPPGVGADRIRLASVLPLTGPAAPSGQVLAAGLRAGLAEANARGGVHGRQLELDVADARAGVRAALNAWRERPPFALIGGLWNESTEAADAVLAERHLSHVASLVVREQPPRAGDWSADLLAPLQAQRALLAEALRDCPRGPRLGLAHGEPAVPATEHGVRWLTPGLALERVLSENAAGCIGYTLPYAAAAQAVPPGWSRTLVLPMPGELLQAGGGDALAASPWYRLGQLSARLTVELLSRAGRVLHERALLAQLDRLNEFELAPGLSVHYGRQRRHAWSPQRVTLAPGDATAVRPAAASQVSTAVIR